MFNNAVNIPGSNPIFNHTSQGDIKVYQSSGSEGFKSLTKHVATGALHNSDEVSDVPKCHPGTRVAILESVCQWAMASVYLICIQWIYGPAGAGKSAILRTLAEMLEQHGLLLASFFFFRAAAGRNNADHFIPTIAYQIALSIPSTRRHIEQAIETDPLVFSRSLEAQAQALIILPLTKAHREGSIEKQYPRIIIVDGLDECQGEEKQRTLLRVLNNSLLKLPIPFAVLIASRPEPHIRDIFNSDLNKTSTRLELDDRHEPDRDIQKFYDDKFLEIRERHPLRSHFPKPWPPPPTITTLVDKASGQFIFPATVIKFVEPHRHNPSHRLDMIMGSISPGKLRPFEPLDNLYSTIFASIDPDDLHAVLGVLGVLLVRYRSLDIRWMNTITSLTGYDETEVKQLLFDLESLVHIEGQGDNPMIQSHHASLADFLFDRHRSGRFFVSPPMVHEQLARRCIENVLFSENDFALVILSYEFQHFLHNAEPTGELIEIFKNFDAAKLSQNLNGRKSLLRRLNVFLNDVLPAISSSKFPDANFLHDHLLAVLQEVIASKVDYCFNANLTPLLVYLMDIGCDRSLVFSSTEIYQICFTQIYPIHGDHCPIEIANQDQQNGFCLTLLFHPSDKFELFNLIAGAAGDDSWKTFYTLVINTIGDRAGDCYADLLIHTLNWVCKYPSYTPALLPGSPGQNILGLITEVLLPTLLQRSAPRSDVQQALTENPIHPMLFENSPAYAAAIQEYFLVASEPTPSQPDLPSHSDANSVTLEMHACLDLGVRPPQRDISLSDSLGNPPHPQQQLRSSHHIMPSQNVPVAPNSETAGLVPSLKELC